MQQTELTAGRALDALVAEKVLGWRPDAVEASTGTVGFGTPKGVWISPAFLPPFSTDIAAAWRVVERLREQLHFQITVGSPSDEVDQWYCVIYSHGYRRFQDEEWSVHAPTAPLAICLAALKAVGYDVT